MSEKPQNSDDDKDQIALIKSVMAGSLGSLGLAFCASLVIGLTFAGYTWLTGVQVPDWLSSTVWMTVFCGIVFGDPVSAWKEGKPGKVVVWKLLGGMALGAFISLFIHFKDLFVAEDSPYAAFWLMAPIFLIMPILFGSFALKRFMENSEASLGERAEGAVLEYLDTAGPIVMMVVMGIAFLFYWLASPSLQGTLVIMSATLCAIIAYCIAVYDGSKEPITEETDDLPRSRTLREALWKNLDIATAMLPAALYMGGTLWLMLGIFDWALGGEGMKIGKDGDIDIVSLLQSMLWMMGVALGAFLGSMAATMIVATTAFALASVCAGMGFSEVKMRVEKFNEVMFFGAMARSFHGSLADRDEPSSKGGG